MCESETTMTPDLQPHWRSSDPEATSAPERTPAAVHAARSWVAFTGWLRSKKGRWVTVGALIAIFGVISAVVLSNLTHVPSIAGESLASGEDELAAARLDVGNIDWVPGLDKDFQIVKAQDPAADTTVWAQSTVELEMEAAPATIPDFLASDVATAKELADELGIAVRVDFPFSDAQTWKVLAQDTAAGSPGLAGDIVKLTVEVPEINVPDLEGLTSANAASALEDIGLKGKALPTDHEPDWTVAGQSAAAGTSVPFGTTVDFTLQAPLVIVPELIGKSASSADSDLKALGFVPASATPTAQSTWTITSQEPAAGSQVTEGTTVTYTLTGPTITFEVTGNGSTAMVTWAPPGSFSISQDTNASVPWSMTFPDNGYDRYERGNFNAQMMDGDSITCTMYRNGEVVLTNTSSGPYAVVSCG